MLSLTGQSALGGLNIGRRVASPPDQKSRRDVINQAVIPS